MSRHRNDRSIEVQPAESRAAVDTPARLMEELEIAPEPGSLYHQVLTQVLTAAPMVGMRREHQLMFAQPKNEIVVHFPVLMDDGRHRIFTGYRVQHNNALGPYKGGLRFHPHVTLDQMKGLAMIMSLKCSLLRLPFGGAKGGVRCNPRELARDEQMRVTRRFCSAISNQIGPDYDIPGPGVGTDAQTMAWFVDTFAQTTPEHGRQDTTRAVTGKPIELGGVPGRDRASAMGMVLVLEEMLPDFGMQVKGLRFSLLGFGKVGSWTARILQERGATLVAVMDDTGALRNDKGIDAADLAEHVHVAGGVRGFAASDAVDREEFLRAPVDLFIPAALEGMIDGESAQLIRARVVAEAASLPTNAEGEEVLLQRGIEVLPSLLCNAGGLVASHMEWTLNKSSGQITATEMEERLGQHMTDAARRVRLARHRLESDLRTASIGSALEQISRVHQLRGVFP
jgi:glutamate dehydrogenase (NAD(P)+)